MMSAVGRDRLLFLWHWLDRDVVPKTSAKDLLEARIITSAKAIKITSGRIALQTAEYHKNGAFAEKNTQEGIFALSLQRIIII